MGLERAHGRSELRCAMRGFEQEMVIVGGEERQPFGADRSRNLRGEY